MDRVKVILSGFPGGPGVATHYFLDAPSGLASLRTFWNTMAGTMPVNVNIQIENTGDQIEATTGTLVGTWSGAAQANSVGAQPGAYAAPQGYCVTWETGQVIDGSRVRGRTFIVPAGTAVFDLSGSIAAAELINLAGYANVLVQAIPGNLLVWHRPRVATATLPARSGLYVPVASATIHDRAVVLRSRRE